MRSPTYTKYPLPENYSEIIDVRSQKEFSEDHIPGAINLPVLPDEERVRVGTIYKQISPFEARKIGAALVAKNLAYHLSNHFTNKDKDYSPLIYCWRGGQRSQSMALVLRQIGWQVTVLEGGYKTYRTYVRQQLETLPSQFTFQVLCGLTGTGKTYLLRELSRRNIQVLDLEKLANHRGSLLGQEWQEKPRVQPSQKKFESLLLEKLQQFDVNKTLWVESESNKIGEIYLPPLLWSKMKQASCVEVQLLLPARVEWLLQEYPHLVRYPDILKSKLQQLKYRYGREKIRSWYHLIDTGKWQDLVADLLLSHYDPAYQRSLTKTFPKVKKTLTIPDLSSQSVESALATLVKY